MTPETDNKIFKSETLISTINNLYIFYFIYIYINMFFFLKLFNVTDKGYFLKLFN